MSDSIRPTNPKAPTPKSIKPKPIKPKSIAPKKAEGEVVAEYNHYNPYKQGCIRCRCTITQETGRVGALCSDCDFELQSMHHKAEFVLNKKIVYLTDEDEIRYLSEENYLSKPWAPRKRNNLKQKEASL